MLINDTIQRNDCWGIDCSLKDCRLFKEHLIYETPMTTSLYYMRVRFQFITMAKNYSLKIIFYYSF